MSTRLEPPKAKPWSSTSRSVPGPVSRSAAYLVPASEGTYRTQTWQDSPTASVRPLHSSERIVKLDAPSPTIDAPLRLTLSSTAVTQAETTVELSPASLAGQRIVCGATSAGSADGGS